MHPHAFRHPLVYPLVHPLVLMALLCALALTLTACNLGNVPESPEPLLTDTPVPASKPTVRINSPADGAEVVVDEEVLISVTATDAVGVTNLQLFANGQIVRTISSEDALGDPQLSAVLDYTPRATGTVNLRVLAFRNATASDPADITLNVRSGAAQVTATADPGDNLPDIPNDGVCRALTTVNLNFREQPTTAVDNVMAVLPGGTLAPIVGRLGNNTWWQLNWNGQRGWVSAQFTTEYGNCFNVPIITTPTPFFTPTFTPTPTPTLTPTITPTFTPSITPEPALPDLVPTSFSGEETLTLSAGPNGEVAEPYFVTVTNTGAGPSAAFEVSLTVERDGADDVVLDMGVVSGLDSMGSVVLQTNVTFDAVGSYDLRVDIDPNDQVNEVSEVNNRAFFSVEVNAP